MSAARVTLQLMQAGSFVRPKCMSHPTMFLCQDIRDWVEGTSEFDPKGDQQYFNMPIKQLFKMHPTLGEECESDKSFEWIMFFKIYSPTPGSETYRNYYVLVRETIRPIGPTSDLPVEVDGTRYRAIYLTSLADGDSLRNLYMVFNDWIIGVIAQYPKLRFFQCGYKHHTALQQKRMKNFVRVHEGEAEMWQALSRLTYDRCVHCQMKTLPDPSLPSWGQGSNASVGSVIESLGQAFKPASEAMVETMNQLGKAFIDLSKSSRQREGFVLSNASFDELQHEVEQYRPIEPPLNDRYYHRYEKRLDGRKKRG